MDLRFPQQFYWRFRSSRIWGCVTGLQVQKRTFLDCSMPKCEGTMNLQNTRTHKHCGTVLHPRRCKCWTHDEVFIEQELHKEPESLDTEDCNSYWQQTTLVLVQAIFIKQLGTAICWCCLEQCTVRAVCTWCTVSGTIYTAHRIDCCYLWAFTGGGNSEVTEHYICVTKLCNIQLTLINTAQLLFTQDNLYCV